MIRFPEFKEKKETALDVLLSSDVDDKTATEYLLQVFFAWHDKAFGYCKVTEPMGIDAEDYNKVFDDKFSLEQCKAKRIAAKNSEK
jgi:hypothetical protein